MILSNYAIRFRTAVFVFLVTNVLSNNIFVYAYRRYIVASGPEMIAPIGLFFELAKLAQHPDRRSSFNCADISGNRYLS